MLGNNRVINKPTIGRVPDRLINSHQRYWVAGDA
jgi:hypothetical protein